MNAAIVYYSIHHGNTKKLLDAIAEQCDVTLIDALGNPNADLSSYDLIGFASGIYFGRFHRSVVRLAKKRLTAGKKVCVICTHGARKTNTAGFERVLDKKGAQILGVYGCRGYDTFGPFKLIGGIAKGHPNEDDIARAVAFFKDVMTKC